MRTRGYSLRTEKTYVYWIRFFIRYQKRKHPKEMEAAEVVQFPGFLANDRHVSVNTQKLALNALAFFITRIWNCLWAIRAFNMPTNPPNCLW
jgi:hypothetical protein